LLRGAAAAARLADAHFLGIDQQATGVGPAGIDRCQPADLRLAWHPIVGLPVTLAATLTILLTVCTAIIRTVILAHALAVILYRLIGTLAAGTGGGFIATRLGASIVRIVTIVLIKARLLIVRPFRLDTHRLDEKALVVLRMLEKVLGNDTVA
jgi:hypothetical protein